MQCGWAVKPGHGFPYHYRVVLSLAMTQPYNLASFACCMLYVRSPLFSTAKNFTALQLYPRTMISIQDSVRLDHSHSSTKIRVFESPSHNEASPDEPI
jgi:hypothetical protein